MSQTQTVRLLAILGLLAAGLLAACQFDAATQEYRITGTGQVDILYRDASGRDLTLEAVNLPWSKRMRVWDRRWLARVEATLVTEGQVEVTYLKDDKILFVQEASGLGQSARIEFVPPY